MDKQSFSRYGGIVIVVIILAMMIAFATPFGSYVVTGVKGVLAGFNSATSVDGDNSENESTSLAIPSNLNLDSGVLSFDSVDGATAYIITVGGGTAFESSETSINISDKLTGLGGTIEITVAATNGTKTSESAKLSYTIAGLYQTGSNYTVLLKSWDKLISEGILDSTGKIANGQTANLAGDLAFSNELTEIPNSAFSNCTALTGVNVPSGVISIGTQAFYYCMALTDITLPDSVTSIGNSAFNLCTSLTNITIPDGVTSIGSSAFCYCMKFTSITIPNGVTSIGSSAFSSCTNLTSITIPDSVTSIGNQAFNSCNKLKNVYYEGDVSDWLNIAFAATNTTTYPTYYATSVYFNWNVESNTGDLVTEITIPDGVTSISKYQFYKFPNLTSVTVSDSVTTIGQSAFNNCTSLMSVTIGNGITSIGESAFRNCTSLASVTIEATTPPSIDDNTFNGCSNLTTITVPAGTLEAYQTVWSNGIDQTAWNKIAGKLVEANP